MEGRRDRRQIRGNPCLAGSPLRHPALADVGMAPATPEPQVAPSPHPQQQRETPDTHHRLHQLHPCVRRSAPGQPGEEGVGGRTQKANFNTHRAFKRSEHCRHVALAAGAQSHPQGTPNRCHQNPTASQGNAARAAITLLMDDPDGSSL